jgi:hypothetical protein
MLKIKHARTADCVVAGFRWHKSGTRRDRLAAARSVRRRGTLQHVGVTSSFTMETRRAARARSWRRCAQRARGHPWREWADMPRRDPRRPASRSGCRAAEPLERGKDLSWEPLRVERVCEVKYDHMQGDRFRHAATFLRWRRDKPPSDCRTISSRSRRLSSFARIWRHWSRSASVTGSSSFRIERFLRWPQRLRHVLQVDADARPGAEAPRIASTSTSAGSRCAAASRGGLPALESRQRIVLLCARAISISGCVRRARFDGATRGLAAASVVRRPRRVASPSRSCARTVRAALERSGVPIDVACGSPLPRQRAGHRRQREVAGSHASISSHASGADTRASGVGRTE